MVSDIIHITYKHVKFSPNLDIKVFLQDNPILPGNCESFDFVDRDLQHIVTGELSKKMINCGRVLITKKGISFDEKRQKQT